MKIKNTSSAMELFMTDIFLPNYRIGCATSKLMRGKSSDASFQDANLCRFCFGTHRDGGRDGSGRAYPDGRGLMVRSGFPWPPDRQWGALRHERSDGSP